MRDVFQRIRYAVRKVVQRVDTPGITRAVMMRVTDAIGQRIAQVDVAGSHVDLQAQHHGAIGEFASLHAAEQIEALRSRAIAPGRVGARLRQGAAILADLVGALFVNVGVTGFDELLGKGIEKTEVVGGEVQIVLAFELPAKPQPCHGLDDRVDVFLFFLGRVGVVETHVTGTTETFGKTEIQTDRFGVTEMQITVGFRREARTDRCRIEWTTSLLRGGARLARPVTLRVLTNSQILLDHLHQEVAGSGEFFRPVGL